MLTDIWPNDIDWHIHSNSVNMSTDSRSTFRFSVGWYVHQKANQLSAECQLIFGREVPKLDKIHNFLSREHFFKRFDDDDDDDQTFPAAPL